MTPFLALRASVCVSVGHAPIKVHRYRKKLAEGHINISPTLLEYNINSTDLERVAATELKSVEFVFYSKGIIEIFDVHTDFTAGRMLHLYRTSERITQLRM